MRLILCSLVSYAVLAILNLVFPPNKNYWNSVTFSHWLRLCHLETKVEVLMFCAARNRNRLPVGKMLANTEELPVSWEA